MSYQVLARKWRPKSFNELMGQEHVVTVLVNALAQQRLHHAYLFTGTRGVGKTTIARIFAKSLNCLSGITANPCGTCDVCLEIDQGRFVDLLEIDAASKTKVDDTREILDNVQYAPTRGRFKVYLIDEVHMLSKSSFNALLKTLEEPPEHVKFILATTDPQKLPITVLSRCLQFHLKALTASQIEEKLIEILSKEQVTHENGSLTLLAKAARGSMRDSLSLTDQAIAQGQGNITLANIQKMLGGIDQNWVYKIVIALLKNDAKNLMELSQEIASYAPSYSRLFAELIQLFHQIAMLQVVKNHFGLSNEHAKLLEKFSLAMSADDVQLYYQIVLNSRKDLPYASDEQAAFDMMLLRLLAFRPMQAKDASIENSSKQSENFVEDAIFELPDSEPAEKEAHEQITGEVIVTEASDDVRAELASEMLNIEQQASSLTADSRLSDENEAACNQPQAQLPVVDDTLLTEDDSKELPAVTSTESSNEAQSTIEPALKESEVSDENIKVATPVDAVLATRNMLRSRKKQLEPNAKKSNDANLRHETEKNLTEEKPKADVPDITSISEAPFTPDVIDPATVRKANQVDKWANMIDSMSLNGRIRQLAIHATIDENSTDDNLILKLDQSTKHLNTENAHTQLEAFIVEFLAKPITVTIEIVDQTVADPYQIQSHINDKRYDYAKDLLHKDEVVNELKDKFQATLDDQTIIAR